jgi:hypothetical protein
MCPFLTLQWSVPHLSCCYKPSPFPAYWGRLRHTCLLQLVCLFTIRMGKCPFLPLWWSFPHDSHCYKLSPLHGFWARAPLLPSPVACLLQFTWGSAPSPLSRAQGTHPVCYTSFFFFQLLVYYSVFFFFFPGQGSVCPGCYADLSQGVLHATYLLSWWSPKQVSSRHLAVQELFWFLHLTWWGHAMCRLGVWRCWSFASS